MKYFKKIIGSKVYLSPINPDDYEIYTKWLNDYSVSGNLTTFTSMISLSNERAFLERLSSEGQNYAIVLSENNTLIGSTSLMQIDYVHRTATLGIYIGEAENRGKGYGADAICALVNYGFNSLNLHNIMLEVHSDNKQAIDCYIKVGFHEFGRRSEAKYKNGKYIDFVYMEILDYEFRNKYSL